MEVEGRIPRSFSKKGRHAGFGKRNWIQQNAENDDQGREDQVLRRRDGVFDTQKNTLAGRSASGGFAILPITLSTLALVIICRGLCFFHSLLLTCTGIEACQKAIAIAIRKSTREELLHFSQY